ncbi:hypothetical protein [Streptacidiphilus sp. EB129]|jgi:hypothetical protein|uniref:hypothetical protein n=1 Tax=Streptacidiphilus sp. EB129 TaxID=3156262 RepID=UPI003512EAB7
METHRPYPDATEWTFRNRRSHQERRTPLVLSWEVDGDPITDDYTPSAISAHELWDLWFPKYASDGTAPIHWSVKGNGIAESAPFQIGQAQDQPDFLSPDDGFTWPEQTRSGERVNWLRLPVRDKLWHGQRGDKGGFIQELLGWKPSPLEPVFHARAIAAAAGIN